MVYFYKNNFSDHLNLDVDNLGLLRGFSAFEYLRTYDKKPFCLKAHLLRFLFSMEKMNLTSIYTLEQLEHITLELINRSNGDCGIKWYATGGATIDGLRHHNQPEMFAFTTPLISTNPLYYKQGIKTQTVFEKRPCPEAKTTAYFTACHTLSLRKDLQEIIYVDHHGHLLEAATSNLFLVKDQTIYTAATDVLHGITREVVLELARPFYAISHKKIPLTDLHSFDEVFLSASNKEIIPVNQVNDLFFNVGPITRDLMAKFQELTLKTPKNEYIPELYQKEILLKS